MQTYFITTAIDYANASPHIGHAYEKILADVLARFNRLRGREVFYLTGTDEHGQKNANSAAAAGKDVRAFVGENADRFRSLAASLNLSIDDFIRTTEPRHARGVKQIWERVAAAGDFYKKNYQALYCIGHEAFVTLSDLVDGKCPDHGVAPVVIEEENYFFRLSKYRSHLRRLFEERPDFVVPQARYAEMLNLIDTLEDISVSRPVEKLSWGIPVPGDPSHVIYVWFDALTNYITAVGYGRDDEAFRRWWPAHHVIGKDINRFHSLLWPAMLISAGIEPPRQVLVHGFLTAEGRKISKTLGNVIDPLEPPRDLSEASGAAFAVCVDALRYFLLRDIPFGEDGDFSRAGLVGRFNSDLANDYGNLLNRTLALVARDFEGRLPERRSDEGTDATLRQIVHEAVAAAAASIEQLDFRGGLEAVWRILAAANKYIDGEAPWSAIKRGRPERAGTILYNTLEAVRIATILLSPVLPTAAQRVWDQLGISQSLSTQRLDDARRWGGLPAGTIVRPGAPIFPRIDTRRKIAVPAAVPVGDAAGGQRAVENVDVDARGGRQVDEITIDDFRRLDIRIGEITAAERVAGTDKLIKLSVDIGDDVRTVVAGVATHYQAADLVGRRIVVLANLKPRQVRGVESRGMMLAATWGNDVAILTVDGAAPKGSKIS